MITLPLITVQVPVILKFLASVQCVDFFSVFLSREVRIFVICEVLTEEFSGKLVMMHRNDLCTCQLFSLVFFSFVPMTVRHTHEVGDVDRGTVDTRFYICYPSPNNYIFMQLDIQFLNNPYVKPCVTHQSFSRENPSS